MASFNTEESKLEPYSLLTRYFQIDLPHKSASCSSLLLPFTPQEEETFQHRQACGGHERLRWVRWYPSGGDVSGLCKLLLGLPQRSVVSRKGPATQNVGLCGWLVCVCGVGTIKGPVGESLFVSENTHPSNGLEAKRGLRSCIVTVMKIIQAARHHQVCKLHTALLLRGGHS